MIKKIHIDKEYQPLIRVSAANAKGGNKSKPITLYINGKRTYQECYDCGGYVQSLCIRAKSDNNGNTHKTLDNWVYCEKCDMPLEKVTND